MGQDKWLPVFGATYDVQVISDKGLAHDDVLNDASRYDSLQDDVFGVISHFKDDEWIFVWDILMSPIA